MKFTIILLSWVIFSCAVHISDAHKYKKVCYFANWDFYRTGEGQYFVNKVDPFECTHLNYAFAVLDETTYQMKVYDGWVDLDKGGYSDFTLLKKVNPALKTLIAFGGWNDSQGSKKFSQLVSDPQKRSNFVTKSIEFLKTYGFDGIDFDWEYPGDPGEPSDKENFVLMLRELRAAYQPYGYLVTIAVSCSIKRAQLGYDIKAIAAEVDFINFMAYDIHGSWESWVDHHAPLNRRQFDQTDSTIISESVDYWLNNGMPADKIIFGVPAYGRSFRLANESQTAIGSPAQGAGPGGHYTQEDGFLSLYEICLFQQSGWTVVPDNTSTMGPYLYSGKTWAGWVDVATLINYVKYAMSKNLGGIMVWELGLDDFNGFCNMGGPKPFLRAIEATLSGLPFDTSTPSPTPTRFPITTTKPMRCSVNGEYYVDPSDCHKYFRCDNGIMQSFTCPGGLVFNINNKNCDYPSTVGSVPGC